MLEHFRIERKGLGELPEDRPELSFEIEQSGGEEVRQRRIDIAKLQVVSQVLVTLYRERESRRRRVAPAGVALRPLQRIERPVDLDRIELPRRVVELIRLAQPLRIEDAAP